MKKDESAPSVTVLSVHGGPRKKGGDPVKHYIIAFDRKKNHFYIRQKKGPFKTTIPELIQHHMENCRWRKMGR